jgi:hypothetical protein
MDQTLLLQLGVTSATLQQLLEDVVQLPMKPQGHVADAMEPYVTSCGVAGLR